MIKYYVDLFITIKSKYTYSKFLVFHNKFCNYYSTFFELLSSFICKSIVVST